MAKIIEINTGKTVSETDVKYFFDCPGCKQIHGFSSAWKFNKNFENPTVSPSILARWTMGEARVPHICHSFIKEGKIQFLGDCTHHLKGQTVELPECEF